MDTEYTSLSEKREALNRTTENYKQIIQAQVSDLKDNASEVTKRALLIGGGVVVTYFLGRAIYKSIKKKDSSYLNELKPAYGSHNSDLPAYYGGKNSPYPVSQVKSQASSPIASLIKKQIALFLIAIAKQKIQQVIERSRNNDTEHSRQTTS